MSDRSFSESGLTRRDLLKAGLLGGLVFSTRQIPDVRKSMEALRQPATELEWFSGAVLIGRGQGYFGKETHDSNYALYTLGHVIENLESSPSIPIKTFIPPNYVYEMTESTRIYRTPNTYIDPDPCVEIPISQQNRAALEYYMQINPYLRLYHDARVIPGAYVASPNPFYLYDNQQSRWTVSTIVDIQESFLSVQPFEGNICQGRSGGAHILIENPHNHDGQIIPIRSTEGNCLAVGISERIMPDDMYEGPEGRSCGIYVRLSRPILKV